MSLTSFISVGTWYGMPSLIVHSMPPPWTDFTFGSFGFTLPEFEGGHTEIDRDFAFAALPNATQVVVRLDIVGHNECATNASEPGGSLCNIWTNAGNTAYLGVEGDYVSVSGYAYPGFALAAPVPEPETAALLAAGLVTLAALRRRTARR